MLLRLITHYIENFQQDNSLINSTPECSFFSALRMWYDTSECTFQQRLLAS